MGTMTVGELKKLIAKLPDDYLIEAVTAGDYEVCIDVRRPVAGSPLTEFFAPLEDLVPFETPRQRAARLGGKGNSASMAEFIDSLINTPEEKTCTS